MSIRPSAGFDALGKGVEEGKQPAATKYVSKGLTRSRTDNLVVVRSPDAASAPHDTTAPRSSAASAASVATGNVTQMASGGAAATALKTVEPERAPSPTDKLDTWGKAGSAAAATPSKAERRAEAKAKGYEGDMCGECSNFTLVRNGTCMKCDTCGSTTGCS